MFRRIIDDVSAAELRSCAVAKYHHLDGWTLPGQQGLVGSPSCLLAATLLRIAGNEPPIGAIFAQGVAERIKKGDDAQVIAKDLLAMLGSNY